LELAELLPWIIAAVAVIVIVLIVIAVMKRKKRGERSERLRDRVGSAEYDRTVDRVGSRSDAEDQLEARLERREKMRLRSLDPEERDRFVARWEDLQASFVDGPASAIRGADVLLDDVARARGYPDASAEQRLDDLAMDHSDQVHEYRRVNYDGKSDDADGARQALLASRGLFEALVGLGRGAGASSAARHDRSPEDETTQSMDTPSRSEERHDTDRGDTRSGDGDGTPTDDRRDASTDDRRDASTDDRRGAEDGRPAEGRSEHGEPAPEAPFERVLDGDDVGDDLHDRGPRADSRTIPPPPPAEPS
jgi:hypothetical protein